MLNRLKKKYMKKYASCERYARYMGVNMGENCYISTKSFPTEAYLITIGNNVRIASGVSFYTHGGVWPFRHGLGEDFDMFGKINIGNNVHVGQGAYILPGVTIGNNVIIGAGAVVTKSIPDNCIVGGNPAKVIGDLDEFLERIKQFNLKTKRKSHESKKKYLLNLEDEKFIKK